MSGFVDLSFTWFDLFLHFYKAGRKGQCFIAFMSWKFLWPTYFQIRSLQSFVTFFDCMSASPMSSSVWYLQWSIQLCPSVFYSVLGVTSWCSAYFQCTAPVAGTAYVIFLLRCGLRIMFPESWEKWNTRKFYLVCFFTKSTLKCFKLVYSLILCVYLSRNKCHLSTYLDVAWEQRFQSPRRNKALSRLNSWNYIQCSLILQC